MPTFVSCVILLYLFAIVVPWFPAFGKGSGFADEFWHLTLPASHWRSSGQRSS